MLQQTLTPLLKRDGRLKVGPIEAGVTRRCYRLAVSAESLRSVQLGGTLLALVVAPLFFGSVVPFWVVVWTLLLASSALCGSFVRVGREQSRILLGFILLCGFYALVAALQIIPIRGHGLTDPVWQRASGLLELDLQARISSRAEIPFAAVGHFLLMVTSFVNGFLVGTSVRRRTTLFRFARYTILFYAIYGLLAYFLTPNMVLWAPKNAYEDSLTATFINHNTAATFIGAGMILWCCSTVAAFESLGFLSLRLVLLKRSNEDFAIKFLARAMASLTCFVALLLTGSRGGLICSCAGAFVAIAIMAANRRGRRWYLLAYGGAALLTGSWLLSRTGRIGSQGLFDDARWRVYGLCVEAIRDRPFLGAGAGTFGDLFPALRPPDFHSWGVWEYAHSTILEIAVEMGVPVAGAVLVGAIGSVLILVRGGMRARDPGRGVLSATAGIAVLGYLHSTIDFPLQIPGFLVVFGILLGAGLASVSIELNRQHGSKRRVSTAPQN
jgi:O-antigen ligase